MFGAAAAYGAMTKRSLASIGGYLFMGLIGIIIASFVNLFLLKQRVGQPASSRSSASSCSSA